MSQFTFSILISIVVLWSDSKQLWTQPHQWSWVPRDCWCLRTMPRPILRAQTSHSARESPVGLRWTCRMFADLLLSRVVCSVKLPGVLRSASEAYAAAAGARLSHQHQCHCLLESQRGRCHRLLPGLLHGGPTRRLFELKNDWRQILVDLLFK